MLAPNIDMHDGYRAMMTSLMKSISVLGSTGSIGTQTLDVADRLGWSVEVLAAGRNLSLLTEQIDRFQPSLVVCHPDIASSVRDHAPSTVQVQAGDDALNDAARVPVDTVVAAIPGMAGVPPVLSAVEAGQHIALATKEAMVVAGPIVNTAARATGARITPVDSEHAGVAQLLIGEDFEAVDRIVLTASGGPFRKGPVDLTSITPEEALNHPTWSMGPRVTIDSSTLFNKGLEVLEAHHLFGVSLDRIEVVVHPQSLVHALIRYRDGSLKAHVGPHDMRLAILWGIEETERPSLGLEPMALSGVWEFEPPDLDRFPALSLAYQAGRLGGTAPAALNAADEMAVMSFLSRRISYPMIADVLRATLEGVPVEALSWEAVKRVDASARAFALQWIDSHA